MGDPAHFSVQGGANPHTRTWLGARRRVNARRAIDQWHGLRHALCDAGVRVVVVPPHPTQPGLVYPANAGFLTDLDAEKSLSQKTFYLSNLLPTRAGEKNHYRQALQYAGYRIGTVDERYRFEGEADFFPVADHHLLTHGGIERQRFVPRIGIPPWKRIYGFRTDARIEPLLTEIVKPRPVLRLELTLEAHYHGDTALCAFGPRRQHLLVYKRALTDEAWDTLSGEFAHALVELSDEDAARYAANSFTLTQGSDSLLFMPEGASPRLQDQVRERGVTPVLVDVSEFLKKGGGSIKCMIGDLGPVADDELLGMSGKSGASEASPANPDPGA